MWCISCFQPTISSSPLSSKKGLLKITSSTGSYFFGRAFKPNPSFNTKKHAPQPTRDHENPNMVDQILSQNRNCVVVLTNVLGNPVTVRFDDIGIPSMDGMEIVCVRRPEDALADGDAWTAERTAMCLLGFEIIELQNAILIFSEI